VSRNLAVAVVAFQATLVFAAPQPETVPTLHAQTRVVQIEVAVKDSKGHPVGNLSKKDFNRYRSGHGAGYRYFQYR